MKWVTPWLTPDGYNYNRAPRKFSWGGELGEPPAHQPASSGAGRGDAQGETSANVTYITAREQKVRSCGITFDYAEKTNPVFNFLKWRLQAMWVHRAPTGEGAA